MNENDITKNQWKTLRRIAELTPEQRAAIFQFADSPFNRYEFLEALENNECVGAESGWTPHHQLLSINNEVKGLLICYQKSHSYGEYVFDWSWADAYHRNGVPYYPKLLSAIPFTPVPCTKWLSDGDISLQQALQHLLPETSDSSVLPAYSGVHYLYPKSLEDNLKGDWICRHGQQFHWFNRKPDGSQYIDFDDFLGQMTARKRKNINKERQKVQQAGISCQWLKGDEINEQHLEQFYLFYHATYYKRGQTGYLNKAFFKQIFATMSEQVRLLVCSKEDEIVATALYFLDQETLYGRYWGCGEEYDALHFEACYYQGIEFCIQQGLRLFNPGTQGEHKISRGFEPTLTYSYHQLMLPPFQQAIKNFCDEERQHNAVYMQNCRQRLPFKTE